MTYNELRPGHVLFFPDHHMFWIVVDPNYTYAVRLGPVLHIHSLSGSGIELKQNVSFIPKEVL